MGLWDWLNSGATVGTRLRSLDAKNRLDAGAPRSDVLRGLLADTSNPDAVLGSDAANFASGLLGPMGAGVGLMGAIKPRDFNLPVNPDGTVTLFHGTTKKAAKKITQENALRSAGEPDVYLTNSPKGTGYGDGTVVAVDVHPSKLHLDDAFPDGRFDFRLPTDGSLARVKAAKLWSGE